MGAFAAPIMRRSNNTPGIYLAEMPSALIPRPKVSATRSLACPWTNRKVKLAPSSGPSILIISLRSRIQKYHIFSRGKDEGGGGGGGGGGENETGCASYDTGRRETLLAFLRISILRSYFPRQRNSMRCKVRTKLILRFSSAPPPPLPACRSLFVNLPARSFFLYSSRPPLPLARR